MRPKTLMILLACMIAGLLLILPVTAAAGAPAMEWQRCLGGAAPDDVCAVQQTLDGGYILAGGANFTAAPLIAPFGDAVRFTVTPAAGKAIRAAWWSFDYPTHGDTWNSRNVNPTFYYPWSGIFSPLVKITYTDSTTEVVHLVNYVSATVDRTATPTLPVEQYHFVTKWGSEGSGDGEFDYPAMVAVDGLGNIYVVDINYPRVQKFTSDGTFLTKWGTSGSGDGQFLGPLGVAVDDTGTIYVVDSYNNQIQKFDSAGTFIMKWGSQGSGEGQFDSPMGVAVDSTGNVYVVDTDNNRIQKFTSNGTFITKWGTVGTGIGQFLKPYGVAVDGMGNVYVTDISNVGVQKFTADGAFVMKWGTYGSGDGQFMWPMGIAVDSVGNVYVTDTDINQIKKFTSTGTFITKWGTYGSGDGQFILPDGIAVDSKGNVYVADTNNHRVQKFAPVDPTPAPTPTLSAASFVAVPTSAPYGDAVRFTVTPTSGKSIRSTWWSFDAMAHMETWNSRTVNPTFFYPRAGIFSPYVEITYTDGSIETVQKTNYVQAT